MAKVLVVGGGFAGVVAAESLAQTLGSDHQITLAARTHEFVFYPALVRLAFGKAEPDDITFDLREAMLDRKVRFIEGEVARIHLNEGYITFAGGDVVGEMAYDFLVLALGRRLATERISGFFEHCQHLLSAAAAGSFAATLQNFHRGHAVIGHCPGARLPVPVFETALALSQWLRERGERDSCRITVVSEGTIDDMFGVPMSEVLTGLLAKHDIEFVSNFPIARVTGSSVIADDGRTINCDFRMLVPPFVGPGPLIGQRVTDEAGYVRVDATMRVHGHERVYAAGDCVDFDGPKLGHMAVRQARVAADNITAAIAGRAPASVYDHQLKLVIDAGGKDSIFAQGDLWSGDPPAIKSGRFWSWAKRVQERYWESKLG